eukprot:552957-Pleurochrysis_carterae.AAC.1
MPTPGGGGWRRTTGRRGGRRVGPAGVKCREAKCVAVALWVAAGSQPKSKHENRCRNESTFRLMRTATHGALGMAPGANGHARSFGNGARR